MHARRALTALLVGGLTVAATTPALAHTGLVSSGPKEGAVVAHLPRTVIVNLSAAPQEVVTSQILFAGADDVATRTRLNPTNARQVRISTRTDRPGAYTVKITILLPDGHTQLVSYRFRVRR